MPPAEGSPSQFRPDIEGVRAIAVMAVLLYHMQVPGFGGGFTGVDVFNVISGFLITGLLVREMTSRGSIDLPRFYFRRVRRLLPAGLLVILVTLVVSYLILSPVRFPSVAGDGAASALYVANYRFALAGTDYLASNADPSPYQHFWSLAVEEQFYLIWPLLILVVSRLIGVRRVGVVLAGVTVGSFLYSLYLTDVSAPWAFFSLPTRAWELGLGGLVAVGVGDWLPRRLLPYVGALGLALVIGGTLLINESVPYPGTAALAPVLGTACLIIGAADATGRLAHGLGSRAPRFLGGISYSLYLWHWPLLILVPIALSDDSLALRLVLGAVAVGFAVISTRFIEAPFRFGRIARTPALRGVVVGLTVSVIMGTTAIAAGAVALDSLSGDAGPTVALATPRPRPTHRPAHTSTVTQAPSLMPSAAGTHVPAPSLTPIADPVTSGPVPKGLDPKLKDVAADLPEGYADGCHLGFDDTESGPCIYGPADATTTVVIFGDSHAEQWLPAIEDLAFVRGWRVVALTKSSCPPVDVPVWNGSKKREYRECDAWHKSALARIDAEQPAIVFVGADRQYDFIDGGTQTAVGDDPSAWGASLARMIERVSQSAPHVVLLGETPHLGVVPDECLASHKDAVEKCQQLKADVVDSDYAALEDSVAASTGAQLISMTDLICPGTTCPLIFGTTPVYRDTHHLGATFSQSLSSYFDQQLPQR